MRQNLELKAKYSGPTGWTNSAIKWKATLNQTDTYFTTETGRLKLRVEDNRAYAILYDRPDVKSEKMSNYIFYPVDDYQTFMKVFGGALRTEIVVKKSRELYMFENARIHFDTVDNLGTFVEIEVVIGESQNERDPHQVMSDLVRILGIKDEDRIDCGYRELLMAAVTN